MTACTKQNECPSAGHEPGCPWYVEPSVLDEFVKLGEQGAGSYALSKESGLMPGKAEPTEPGWYAYSGGAQSMIFLLQNVFDGETTHHDWYAITTDGLCRGCDWGYIEQALGVWDLVPLVPDTAPKPDAEGIWHVRSCREGATGHPGCYDVVSGLLYGEVKT